MNNTGFLNLDLSIYDKGRDIKISIIRLISTLMIIACHFLQYLNYEIAWWLNVGVQIFLFMSGYLYAKRSFTNNDLHFIKKQFVKILVDYYIVVVPIITLYFLFLPNEISFKKAIYVLLAYKNLGGGSIHLWYIPYCLFCYLVTPLLSRVFDELFVDNHLIIKFFVIMILVFVVSWTFLGYFNSAWVSCYILGFFISRLEVIDDKKLYKRFVFVLFFMTFVCNTIQIFIDYVLGINITSGFVLTLYKQVCNYFHTCLGSSIFILIKMFLSCLSLDGGGYSLGLKRLCSISDKLSYDIYLVHLFFIMGPFSLMEITSNRLANISLIMIIIIVCAIAVNFLSSHIKRLVLNNK